MRATFADICQFPFTHLHTIILHNVNFERLTVAPLQHLLSSGTLRRLVIRSLVADPAASAEVWERVSPSVKHLDWLVHQDREVSLPARSTPMTLDSLRLIFIGDGSPLLTPPQFLFDFSRLRALSLNGTSGALLHELVPDLPRLEVLDYMANEEFDLSHLRTLTFIRVVVSGQMIQTAVNSLLTLAATDVRELTIYGYFLDRKVCVQLDAALDSPPL
ncbi:hypothetical protein C8R43DRAFT_976233 [Mycena crocata]|nr:hypothetical protein C8R43DRAFT_976233 [Mycena crocata]